MRHLCTLLVYFDAVLAQTYANLLTLYARPTYTYATVRKGTSVIRNLRHGYAIFIRYNYVLPKHKVRNHTPSYASLRTSCVFFMHTQPE